MAKLIPPTTAHSTPADTSAVAPSSAPAQGASAVPSTEDPAYQAAVEAGVRKRLAEIEAQTAAAAKAEADAAEAAAAAAAAAANEVRHPHGFCGRTVTVEFLKINDPNNTEPRDIFVGVNDYQARIQRGKVVTIPEEVFDVLKGATYTVNDADPDTPEVAVWVEKQRNPYNVISRQG